MISNDMIRHYPRLAHDYALRLVDLQDHILSTYDRRISDYATKQFKGSGECSVVLMVAIYWGWGSHHSKALQDKL